jgi:hypothetical protein
MSHPYTLEQAEDDIAKLRGDLDRIFEHLQTNLIVAESPTSPGVDETWHDLGALGVTNLTVNHHRYRLEPDGVVTIDVDAHATNTIGASNASFPTTLAASYRPANFRVYVLARQTGAGSGTTAIVSITTGGTVNLAWPALVNGDDIGGTIRMPVD